MIEYPTAFPMEKVIFVAADNARYRYIQSRHAHSARWSLNEQRFTYENLWLPVGRRCVARDVDPGDFVKAVNEYHYGKAYPNVLLGDEAFHIYDDWYRNNKLMYKQSHEDGIRIDLKGAAYRFEFEWKTGHYRTPDEILRKDPERFASAAFRWCIATLLKAHDLAAVEEYSTVLRFIDPVYRDIYAKAFPALWPAQPATSDTAKMEVPSHD